MNADILDSFERCLGWTLVHFLWQGAIIAAVLAVALRMFRRAAPNRLYLAGCVALLFLGLAPVTTAYFLTSSEHHAVISASEINAPIVVSGAVTKWVTALKSTSPNFDFARQLEEFLPWVVVGWGVGVAAFSCRLAAGWLLVNRLRRVAATALDAEWHGRLEKLKRRLGITRPVQLLQSALLEVPSVIGWLKPVILLPAGCVAGLSPAQLESILAHELAHIRRHDYLVNLLQSILETLLFYHPAVWWVSRKVREERENCCDDLAVEACGNRIEYVRALAALEEMRAPARLALAANGSELLPRIRRLAGKTDGVVNRAAWPIAGIIVLLFLGVMFFGWHRHLKAPSRSVTSSTNTFVRQSGARETRTFHLSRDIFDQISRTAGSTNLDTSMQTSIIQFFKSAGVDWDTNYPAKTGQAYVYTDRRGLMMVRSTPRDLDLIEQALTRETILQNHGVSSVAPPAQMALPPPPARVARKAAGAAMPSAVTDAIIAAPKQAAAASGRPLPPIPSRYAVPPAAGVVDPQNGLPVVADAPTPAEYTAMILAAQRQAAANAGRPFPPPPPPLDVANSAHALATSSTKPDVRLSSAFETRTFHLLVDFFGPVVKSAGVDLNTNNPANIGKMFAYNNRRDVLTVHNTASDLDLIEQAIAKLNNVPPEVNLKVVFIELGGTFDPLTGPDGIWKKKLRDVTTEKTSMGKPDTEVVTNGISTINPSTDVTSGILPQGELKLIINKLEQRKDGNELNMPEVTTESGRQAQVQAVDMTSIVTGVLDPAASASVTGTNRYKTLQLPVGPVVDLVPEVLKGNDDIRLNVIPSVTEFLGYDTANPPLPRFRVRQFATQRTIHDGETIVLIGSPKHLKKNLLVFVTATLINPDGTRYHP